MAERSLGWVQNPSDTDTLHRVVSLFCADSAFYKEYVEVRIPLIRRLGKLHDQGQWETYMESLASGEPMPYSILKGRGCGNGSRANAPCSGILQAAIDAQKRIAYTDHAGNTIRIKKPYTDDWTADGFLRWAISLGFVDYDALADTCTVSAFGRKFVSAVESDERDSIMGEAYLQYPPACRILDLLSAGEPMTKFDLGRNLGFTTEAGFTSFPQNLFLQALADNPDNRTEIKANYEGSSDKYARMICKWLERIGWVIADKQICQAKMGSRNYSSELTVYRITAEGLRNLKRAKGTSSAKRLSKVVYLEMLSTKAADKQYLRLRRAHILKYLGTSKRTMEQIAEHLLSVGYETSIDTIKSDIEGFISIGLNVVKSNDNIRLADTITHLAIPTNAVVKEKSETLQIKERVEAKITHIHPKFLSLVDLAFDGDSNRQFEIVTMDLLTNELGYEGTHLGGSRKPDGVMYYQTNGLIIDTKAYSKGYSLPRNQVDEMTRYVRECLQKDAKVNANQWWEVFPEAVVKYYFAFISSIFTTQVATRLKEISDVTGTDGACIGVENLLYLADEIKSQRLPQSALFSHFRNREIIV